MKTQIYVLSFLCGALLFHTMQGRSRLHQSQDQTDRAIGIAEEWKKLAKQAFALALDQKNRAERAEAGRALWMDTATNVFNLVLTNQSGIQIRGTVAPEVTGPY